MSTLSISREFMAAQTRTRKSLVVSVGIHVLLFMWILLAQKIVPEEIGITEITWIEPVVEPPALPPILAKSKPVPAVETSLATPSMDKIREKFKRDNPFSPVAPEPQKEDVALDKIGERLAFLQRKTKKKPDEIAALSTPSPVGRSTLAGVDTEKRSKRKPTELNRNTNPNSKPVELKRGPKKPQRATMLMTPTMDIGVEPARIDDTDTNAQRKLAGALLTGPVADRPLLSYSKPHYPEWAKEEAVEGSVTIRFNVMPDGRIKENVMVEKTSGFAEFDNNAVNALLTWRFASLKGKTGDQWGKITFHYRLSDSS